MKFRMLVLAFVAALAVAGCADATAEPQVQPQWTPRGVMPAAASGADFPGDVLAFVDELNRVAWIAAVEAEQAREAFAARSAPVVRPSSYAGVGDCTGFAIPDHIIQRESGGDPYAVNQSSGAFGCAQVMPFHWAPGGACAGLDPYSIDDQRTCVDWLSQGGTRLSPWSL